jgi:chloramphenicol-sensitive protein RarD
VVSGHVIDTSLGYFITPLVSVVVAVGILGERLNRSQKVAVALAAAGVLFMAWQLRHPPWVALTLALSFGFYGLIRKLAPFDSIRGLAVESGVMFFPAVGYLVWCELAGQGTFGHGHWRDDALLVTGGPITAVPLALFAFGAQRVSMLTLGLAQYIAPTVALLLGIWVFHEPFGSARQVAFGCIWAALVIFSVDALRRYRGAGAAPR